MDFAKPVDWDARYKRGWAYGKEPSVFVVEAVTRYLLPTDGGEPPSEPPSEPLRGLHVLDLGAGQGRNGVHLAGLGATVTAVDSSAVGLRKAALLASQRGVPASRLQTRLADLDAYRPGPSSCDVILCIFCALPLEPRARLLARCAAALRPGGLLLVECYAPRQAVLRGARAAGPPVDRLVGAATLSAEVGGLELLEAAETESSLDEGRFHAGLAAVARVVARKPEHAAAVAREAQRWRRSAEAQRRAWRRGIDAVFDEFDGDAAEEALACVASRSASGFARLSAAASATDSPLDPLLLSARALLSVSCRVAARDGVCRYCWMPPGCCVCARLASEEAPRRSRRRLRLRWAIVSHPCELLRSTSSARLASVLAGGGDEAELLAYGAEAHEARLEELLRCEGSTRMLFPGADAESEGVAEAVAAAVAAARGAKRAALGENERAPSPTSCGVAPPADSGA
ncbi:hypothetical protein EMIHUDRAFT_232847 [Emiliania huxleyi CCMP1516]|uniref:Methyltransferase domain-containing protein n=3 Tax=Emiliania huxleyi TaxID=2903 RepID=A0A0D3K408_EMIH1|nr:hypothetical protein EMIHUDRAFT_232847 [Emiliania huxleyi CCMP1516]EOD30493.1 hypothetical protein EMIHUDRAFT_232847 [Emiliania huxleyi CCMP1516]|eukprot:XP_005782922.1 hypothetical protein EMIHUDRAFT_232847 [Emiliania huxleyi CCMP1516]